MNRYIAIVCIDDDSSFGVHFPDLPGCVSAGDTFEEAVDNASIALRMWAQDVTDLPAASTMGDLRRQADVLEDLASGGVVVMVPLLTAGRKQRLNIMLEPSVIEATDQAAKAAGVSRSVFIERTLTGELSRTIGAVQRTPSKRKVSESSKASSGRR